MNIRALIAELELCVASSPCPDDVAAVEIHTLMLPRLGVLITQKQQPNRKARRIASGFAAIQMSLAPVDGEGSADSAAEDAGEPRA